ncbi:DH domain-containing protein [Plasmodiophora brassicae]|uniref:DH domain-containing protein n=1 Tax=Plasmodiophora brassicae TaxID=37360 RepID=A0A3P3YMG2_PLABS|nr:unnamed protein product [Plasmodiophora brassicae]
MAAAAPVLNEDERMAVRRDEIVRELLVTEKNYVDSLNAFFSAYVPRIGAMRIISIPDFAQLCSNLEVIRRIHMRFYGDLQIRIDNGRWGPNSRIADLFMEYAPFFRVYGDIIHLLETVGTAIQDLIYSSPEFEQVLKVCREDSRCKRHTLQSILIMPIQRIPRYFLILKAILQHTPENHPERALLQEALALVETVTQQVNQAAHDLLSRKKIVEIHKKMPRSFDLFQPGRRFVLKSKMATVSPLGELQPAKFILFNDALLHVKNFFGSYKILKQFNISPISAFGVFDVRDTYFPSDKAETIRNRFRVADGSAMLEIQCNSSVEKQMWVEALEKCVRDSENRICPDSRAIQEAIRTSDKAQLLAKVGNDAVSQMMSNVLTRPMSRTVAEARAPLLLPCSICLCPRFQPSFFTDGKCICQHEQREHCAK